MAPPRALRVFRARIGFGERLVAAWSEREALKLLGFAAADKEKNRFREIEHSADWIKASNYPGVVFAKLAGRSSEKWRQL